MLTKLALSQGKNHQWRRITALILFESLLWTAPSPPLTALQDKDQRSAEITLVRSQVRDFLAAWLIRRNSTETLAYIDGAAYTNPPLSGAVCDGWYKRSDAAARVREIVGKNLIGSAATHPEGTPLEKILLPQALPDELKRFAVNPPDVDHFLLTIFDRESLNTIFHAGPNVYRDMIKGLIDKNGPAYWAVMPTQLGDGDAFVVYTVWQQLGGEWRIRSIDISCQ